MRALSSEIDSLLRQEREKGHTGPSKSPLQRLKLHQKSLQLQQRETKQTMNKKYRTAGDKQSNEEETVPSANRDLGSQKVLRGALIERKRSRHQNNKVIISLPPENHKTLVPIKERTLSPIYERKTRLGESASLDQQKKDPRFKAKLIQEKKEADLREKIASKLKSYKRFQILELQKHRVLMERESRIPSFEEYQQMKTISELSSVERNFEPSLPLLAGSKMEPSLVSSAGPAARNTSKPNFLIPTPKILKKASPYHGEKSFKKGKNRTNPEASAPVQESPLRISAPIPLPQLAPAKITIPKKEKQNSNQAQEISREQKQNLLLLQFFYGVFGLGSEKMAQELLEKLPRSKHEALKTMEQPPPLEQANMFIGPGNNSNLIYLLFKQRTGTSRSAFLSNSNAYWSQMPNKKQPPSSCKVELKPVEVTDSRVRKFVAPKKPPKKEDAQESPEKDTLFEQLRELLNINKKNKKLMESISELLEERRSFGPSPFQSISSVSYYCNHLPFLKVVYRKHLLYQTISSYCHQRGLNPHTILPKTFVVQLDSREKDIEHLLEAKKSSLRGFEDPLILKPGENANRGHGIVMVSKEEDVRPAIERLLAGRKKTESVVVQDYLARPLLFKGRKFDIRCFGLVVKVQNRVFYFWYPDGYARTSSFLYGEGDKEDLRVHLTNEAIQVKDQKAFGRYEPGNKVYYNELNEHFGMSSTFVCNNKSFLGDIVPRIKVDRG